MTDRLVTYAERSLAYHIDQQIADFDNVVVVTPDFDWNRKPDPSDPKNKSLPRALPYAAIVGMNDQQLPFTVGNILYETAMMMSIHVCGSTYTQMKNLTADMKQTLRSAVNPITGGIGIVLYNFAVVSGSFYANAGTLGVELGITEYFGPADIQEQDNTKYRSVTPIVLSAYKDNTATLLENKGRLSFNDT